ncbi:MAG: M1 family aminopeptidase, partial [Longimicrobiales bacterium]
MYLNRPARTAALLLVFAPACARGPVAVSRSAPVPPAVAITPGVSQALAQARAATLRTVRYDMILDLTGAERARGRIGVDVVRSATAGELVLDFRGPALDSVRVNGVAVSVQRAAPQVSSDGARTSRAADAQDVRLVRPSADWRDGHIIIPRSLLRPGENHIDALFEATIAAAGASIIRFQDDSDGNDYLYTLLVPADANQLFPSFDQPDLKARVTFHAIVRDDWRVLANGPQHARTALGDGRVRYDFGQTRPISTYLVAFATGPWTTLAADDTAAVPTSLWVRASRADAVDGDTLLATNAWARAWLQQYFDSPFPFAKMDLLLAPAFPFGGMEHVGAIFYNENSFIFREPPTLVQRLARDATIYHEVAHQWFGDLVTMRWFDDLWLKEGFATYMAARIQA